MRISRLKPGSGQIKPGHLREEWPVLLLVAAVLLPTACVLWLMNRAIADQRLVVRQKLADAYRSQLALVRDRVDAELAAKGAQDSSPPPAVLFARLTAAGSADSAIILDAAGMAAYPAPAKLPHPDATLTQPEWLRVSLLEDSDPGGAAALYRDLGDEAVDPAIAARAYQAAARCLMLAGRKEDAAQAVMQHFGPNTFDHASDLQGRLIAADALLMAVQVRRAGDPRLAAPARRLRAMLLDYSNASMPSAQRLFLMREMRSLNLPGGLSDFPTLAAEEMASRLLESEPKIHADSALRLTSISGVWKLGSADGRVIKLYRTDTVLSQLRAFLGGPAKLADVHVQMAPPGELITSPDLLQMEPAGPHLPGWQLAMERVGRDPFEDLAGKQMTLYIWIASLMTAAVVALALVALRGVARRLRLAGMRTDLVATVSHELKTPVASTRLLVDTLLEDLVFDPKKTREYLELIARENLRLSQLIGNFLAFSRMERQKYAFVFAPKKAEDLAQSAIAAAGGRFQEPGCELTVDIASNLPEIQADEGALVTALVNLLDNAYKYTPDPKQITLRAYRNGENVCFDVRDNGMGIAPRDLKKIFRKFYQADTRLARTGGGCGLGLSIVRFLVEAHGGRVSVASDPGKGSTFTVALRAAS